MKHARSSLAQAAYARSERKPLREYPAMIVSMKRGGRDLHARRRRKTKPAPNAYASKPEAWCQKGLFVTGVRSGFVERGVHFEFRPKLPRRPILESGVPQELASKLCCAAGRQVASKRRLHLEASPTLARRDRWGQHGVARSISMRPGRRRRSQDKRQQIVAFARFRRSN